MALVATRVNSHLIARRMGMQPLIEIQVKCQVHSLTMIIITMRIILSDQKLIHVVSDFVT